MISIPKIHFCRFAETLERLGIYVGDYRYFNVSPYYVSSYVKKYRVGKDD